MGYKMNQTIKEVMDFIQENDVKFVKLTFCDIFGIVLMLHTQILFLDKNAASFFAEGKIMRIAVCDDLKNDLQTISFLLDDYMLDRKL